MRYWVLIASAGIALIIAVSAHFFISKPSEGDAAPSFTLEDMSGNEISLDDYRGKVVLVHFWATWCDTCRMELPSVEHLHKKFGPRGLIVLSILGNEDNLKESLAAIEEKIPMSFPVLLDEDGSVSSAYMVYGVPESFIVDRDGVILKRFTGGIDWDALPFISYFDRLLK